MRAFSVEKFTKYDLEDRFQRALAEGANHFVLTSKKQYKVWSNSKCSRVAIDYATARKTPDIKIGEYSGMAVTLNVPPTRSKFNATKVSADGYTFDSQDEYNYYLRLKADQDVEIVEIHPKHVLMPAFVDNKGYRHRAVEYAPDFAYRKKGVLYFVDVKGVETELFKVKWKMFVWYMNTVDPAIICLALDRKGNDLRQSKRKAKK